MNNLSAAKLFIFDLDGTVYQSGKLIGDAKNTLNFLRDRGSKIVYLTNNSICTQEEYKEKLTALGILEDGDLIYSSLDCAIDFFHNYLKDKKVYVVGTQAVRNYLASQGLDLVNDTDPYQADVVLLTYDKELTYQKIVTANELLVMGKEYIATHPDAVCPTSGISAPDAGTFIEMFKISSGRTPNMILGKPYPFMANFLINNLGFSKEQTFMVGDRLYTDILFGVNSGVNTITVLSGETTESIYKESKIRSDYVLKDINEIPKYIREGK